MVLDILGIQHNKSHSSIPSMLDIKDKSPVDKRFVLGALGNPCISRYFHSQLRIELKDSFCKGGDSGNRTFFTYKNLTYNA
jgi:hypothetical protein